MDRDEFVCEARVRFRSRDLHLNKIISQIAIEDTMPSRGPFVDPFDMVNIQQRAERRRRLVDAVAAEFAHALTEALYAEALKA